MIAGLKPYIEMKDSGVDGLGSIPSHWDVRKLRNVLHSATERNRSDLPLLSVVRERGVVLRNTESREENHNFIPEDLSNYKVVHAGQFVMNKMKAWQGSYGVSKHDGIVSPAYFTFDLCGVSGEFFHAAIRSKAYVPFFNQASDGVRIGQWDLSRDRMKEIRFLIPPPEEQAAIVRFLDHADRRIRRAIAAKQKLIRLLEEQKQAIIHRAVTRGLDPDVRLKPSGVEWLGDVPEHWEIMRLKFVASHIVDCLHATPTYLDDGIFPAIRTADISPGIVRLDSARRVSADVFRQWTQRLEPVGGDILYSREGERFGIAACVPIGARLCISQRMMVFRIQKSYDPEFVMWLLNSPQVYTQATQDVMGSTAPHVNVSTIRNFRFAIPPTATEQSEVVRHIHEATQCLVRTIEDAHSEVSLLREYRTRLIADVVTGKLDVLEAAARLPESPESDCADHEALDAEGDDASQDEAIAEDEVA